jgi:hypothetical protein
MSPSPSAGSVQTTRVAQRTEFRGARFRLEAEVRRGDIASCPQLSPSVPATFVQHGYHRRSLQGNDKLYSTLEEFEFGVGDGYFTASQIATAGSPPSIGEPDFHRK